MANQVIDTLQWTPAERLCKTLYVHVLQNPKRYDKDFHSALEIANRCHDVRLVMVDGDETTVYYLAKIGKNSNTGLSYMSFSSGSQTYRWDDPTQEQQGQTL